MQICIIVKQFCLLTNALAYENIGLVWRLKKLVMLRCIMMMSKGKVVVEEEVAVNSFDNEKSSNSDILVKKIHKQGVEYIFLVPGKMIYPLAHAIDRSDIKEIVAAHETACGYMADGYARASNKFGVCLGISGPGAMNFLPAVAAAKGDSVPLLCITGGIATYNEAQGAFQDGTESGIDEARIFQGLASPDFS